MKPWATLFFFFSVISGVLAAKPSDTFEKFQSISRSGPVELDSASFKELSTAPRDYFAAVILTAKDARYGCIMCREFVPEWDLISRSWNKGTKLDGLKVVFGTLDFDHGKDVFQKVRLNTMFYRLTMMADSNPAIASASDGSRSSCVSSYRGSLRQGGCRACEI